MPQVFKAEWKMAPNEQLRNYIEIGWASLSMFQPGVGPTPVDAAVPYDISSESMSSSGSGRKPRATANCGYPHWTASARMGKLT